MAGVEREVELEQGLFLEKLLLRLSDKFTQEVVKASAAIGISPPKRVLLSLRGFHECLGEEGCWGGACGYYDCEREEVVLSLPCAAWRSDRTEALLKTIAHELVHRCQHAGGPECAVRRSCEDMRLLGMVLPYRQRPHEVEAYARQDELAERLRPHLERPIRELWEALTIRLRFSEPPPFKANLLYVEPGGKGELRGPGFTAELAGDVGIGGPILLYWPTSTGLNRELNVDLASTTGGVYVIVGEGATRAFRALKNMFDISERGEQNPHAPVFWECNTRPEWVRRGEEYIEIIYPHHATESSLTIVKLRVGEKTLPYHKLMERLQSVCGGGGGGASQPPVEITEKDIKKLIEELEELLYVPVLPLTVVPAPPPSAEEASKTSPTPATAAPSVDADANGGESPEG
ncbi:hypothetical protein Pogu_0507 [Pyrobaculum oguniense TE7]|uniref:Uncharacterized protein n=1 Tax=Pyrobaculum oguniense (strain DSM 13380 / JCM 10595 / TE7) TaxID=698757 RepID=H6Q770_PYROT|nr:hypothetical protein Pogu_0507 [Pyrobaculum oguniense TE7]